MTSIAQIVRQVIDDLSDGVSELVLLVVVLAEQNQVLPPQLPGASEIVNEMANRLASIARELTRTDYADFEEIAREIIEAADAVDTATNTLKNAIQILQGGGDRKQGWNALVDACRIMAGKTIRLLQIVYGADLKRLQLSADRLVDDIDRFDLNRNLKSRPDQTKFANDLGDVSQKALKMAKLLGDRSNDPAISPFTRDMLRKVAGNLRDKAQAVADAGNDALRDPTLLPKVGNALDDLKKEIQRAKGLATETAPEAPKMDKLKKLLPLLEKAEQKAAAMPAAVRQPEKYERAEKENKDAVQDVVKALKPNPKLKRDVDKLEDNLKDQILSARKALKNPNDPEANKELDKATKALLDALNNLKKRNPEEKLTPEQKSELQNALDNLRKTFSPATNLKPPEQEQEAYERLKDALDGMKKATREEDPRALNNQLRQAVAAGKDLANKMKDPELLKKLPPHQRQQKEDAARDILDSLPRIVKNAAPVLRNPKDEPAAEDLMDAIRRLQRAADRPGRPKDERDLRDNWNDALAALKKAQGAAKKGDPDAANQALEDLANAIANLRKAGDRLKEKNPNPDKIEKPISELEKLFDKFRNKVPEATRGDAAAMRDVDATIPQMQKAWDELNQATRATDIAPIEDVEDAIDKVVIAADSDDPSRIAPAFRDLTQKVNDLGQHIDSLPDPAARKAGQAALDEIRPGLKDLLQKAKEVSQNPNRPGAHDELNDIANRLKAPLAEIKRSIDNKPMDRSAEAAGAAVKKALENLRNAKNTGDPETIRRALDDLRDALGRYNDIAGQTAKAIKDPKKRELLDKRGDDINELLGDLRRIDPTNQRDLRNLMDQIPDRLDDWHDTLRNTAKDDAIKGLAKANNLIASLGSLDENDMDLGDLLSTAGELSNLMRGLIGDTSGLARKLGSRPEQLTAAAQAAMDLDNFLHQLEGKEPTVYPPVSLHQATLESPRFAPQEDSLFEEISLEKARTFDEVLAAVASEMHQAAKNLSAEADSLAKELASLAKAARSGNKQDVLVAAKAASAFIIAFCKQLEILANKIPGRTLAERKEQDNLFRYQQALKNYGIQLKILSSVKAASIEDSRDTDASLTTLTRNLGDVVGAGLHSMVVTRDAIFGGKVPK